MKRETNQLNYVLSNDVNNLYLNEKRKTFTKITYAKVYRHIDDHKCYNHQEYKAPRLCEFRFYLSVAIDLTVNYVLHF